MPKRKLDSTSRRLRLSDVCTEISDRVANPSESEFERFVGLEHMETGETKLRKFGCTADLVSSMKLFKKGDVLVARRNVYLKRAAVADFDGVCSGDAIVLRPKDDGSFLPGIIPFLLNTERFWEYAIKHAAGTMSKRLSVENLLQYEFALPPIAEQAALVEVLRATEATIEAQTNAADIGRLTRSALVEDALAASFDPEVAKPLGTYLTDLSYGSSSRSSYEEKGYPILRIPNVLRGRVDYSDLQHIEINETEYGRLALSKGDVLLVRTNGNPQYVGRSVVIGHLHEKTVYASYLIRIRCDESTLRPAFLAEFLNAPTTRQRLRGEVKSSAGNYNINIAGIRKQPICAPNVVDQDALLQQLKDLDSAGEALEKRVAASKEIKKQLLAEMWGA